jgi:NAD+ diphosphatase
MYTVNADFVHTFAGNPLDRGQHLRKDEAALQALQNASSSRFLLFHQLKVATQAAGQLAWISHDEVPVAPRQLVFLGLDNGEGRFAASVEEATCVGSIAAFSDCRQAVAALSVAEGGIVSQARAMLDWHQRNPFCAVCGNPSRASRGGQVRQCDGCNKHIFPRTDPVAIMLIQNDTQGDYCLLGKSQGRMAQSNFYSALAGFVDQGESLEEAVRREVMEEAGITVGPVSYHSSQPWPFPSSLMIGCHGIALNQDIVIDTEEMADVAWFDRSQVLSAIAGDNPDLRIPGAGAIAHHLIKAWANT